uniref:EB domain-containing protein n=1 Tax=Heterorhabditis bacteriophora TaxID=37862 RepID=A0A1I7X0D0_HETBA
MPKYVKCAIILRGRKQPGEPCQYSRQCAEAEPGAFCLNLKCACIYGMILSGNGCTFASTECTKRGFIYLEELGECKEVIPPGGRGCSHHLQCSKAYPDAFCHHQICRCPLHTPVAIDGTCGKDCSNGETYSGVTGECLPSML